MLLVPNEYILLRFMESIKLHKTYREKWPCLKTATRIEVEHRMVMSRVTEHTKKVCTVSPTGTCRVTFLYTDLYFILFHWQILLFFKAQGAATSD